MVAKHCDALLSRRSLRAAAQPPSAALKWSRLPPGHLASPDHPPSVPADKRCATRVDVIVGLCGSRWPGDSAWKQEEPLSLESNKEPLEAAFFLEEMAEGLTRLDCINICHA